MVLNNLGFLERLQKRTDEAYPHFEEALKIYRQLVQEKPEPYLPDLALTLNNMAISEKDQNHLDLARQHYEETLKVRRDLVQNNPEGYLPELAMTLNDLGTWMDSRIRPKKPASAMRNLESLPAIGGARAGQVSSLCGRDAQQPRISGQESGPDRRIPGTLRGGDDHLPSTRAKRLGGVCRRHCRVDASLKELDKVASVK